MLSYEEVERPHTACLGSDALIEGVRRELLRAPSSPVLERKAAALRILVARPELSDRYVARIVGLSAKTVGIQRRTAGEAIAKVQVRLGLDGRSRRLSDRDAQEPARADDRGATSFAARGGAPGGRAGRPDPVSADADEVAGLHIAVREAEAILTVLARDPSVRHSDSGRALLVRFAAGVVRPADWDVLLAAAPQHCVELLQRMAHSNSRAWAAVAERLRREQRTADTPAEPI